MASRTDQLHSYQFRTRRVLSALVMRETDPQQSPLRRGVGAIFAGVMITILVGAGFGIYGLVTKVGSDDWRQEGSVIVERETGATYVYAFDKLWPTLNLASAMLAGSQGGTVHRVASESLADVPRGNLIGIPGAPDSLPSADQVIGLPWTVCARTELTEENVRLASVDLAVGVGADGGRPLAEDGLLVRDTGPGLIYLVWHGRRYLIASEAIMAAAFGGADLVDVDPAWINALPAGRDIAPIQVDRAGQESATITGFRNGDVIFHTVPGGESYYLVLDDGVYPLSPLALSVLRADGSVTPQEVESQVASRRSSSLPPADDLQPPRTPPVLAPVGPTDAICATTTAGDAPPEITVGAAVPGIERGTATQGLSASGRPLADRVFVPGGRVAVVHTTPVVQTEVERELLTGSYLVVTDVGIAYPLPDASVLPMLGYRTTHAIDIPASLAGLIPLGPALDPSVVFQPAAPPAA